MMQKQLNVINISGVEMQQSNSVQHGNVRSLDMSTSCNCCFITIICNTNVMYTL